LSPKYDLKHLEEFTPTVTIIGLTFSFAIGTTGFSSRGQELTVVALLLGRIAACKTGLGVV